MHSSRSTDTAAKEPPDYSALSLAELKELARKYGLRPSSKQVMAKQLLKIWTYLHTPRETTTEDAGESVNDGRAEPCTAEEETTTAVQVDKQQQTTTTTAEHSIIELSTDSSGEEEAEALVANLSRLQVHEHDADDPLEHAEDAGADILPSDAVLVYDGEEIEEEAEEEDEADAPCEIDTKEKIIQAIRRDKQLYTNMLHYRPIEIEALHRQLDAQDIVCTVGQLRQLLESEVILGEEEKGGIHN
ncbi:hypothetical protein BJ085DRAFT_30136 [Dimargaris cristalligena]|uniref:Structure-specific endonuclease subunit SLX4 n=1 Tax=Dimargaris cristalligena TaxID=215637 RepID=A0A4P9ZXA3_9FUNG|nr:hypothetical protein BJ085DRAFT_30136 [Dimargaris cristalligena]|eukprot:RKP37522.1 hypothetical protein BJ085DRAFT_30136 [Dimargaris cristalligena]